MQTVGHKCVADDLSGAIRLINVPSVIKTADEKTNDRQTANEDEFFYERSVHFHFRSEILIFDSNSNSFSFHNIFGQMHVSSSGLSSLSMKSRLAG